MALLRCGPTKSHKVNCRPCHEKNLPFHLHILLHSCTPLNFWFAAAEVIFCRCKKELFIFSILRKKVRKNTLSWLKGNILLLALLYVQHFLAPLILNSVHEWMDNFLPVSFFMLLNYLLLPQLVAASPLISHWAVAMQEALLCPWSWGASWGAGHPQKCTQTGQLLPSILQSQVLK